MKYFEVERVDETFDRVEYEQYQFGDDIAIDDLIDDALLIEDFEDFIAGVDTSNMTDEEVDEYRDNCNWYIIELDEEEYFGTEEER